MKRMTAKEILVESFRELAKEKNVDKITIKEIVNNCGYSVATFYRNFKDKYDLIAWEYAEGTLEIIRRIDGVNHVFKQALIDSADRYDRERDYLKNLLLHTSGHDAFIQYMTDINYQAAEELILSLSGEKSLDKISQMYVRIYALGTVCFTCEWILGNYKATPKELADIYENSLPKPLKKYLN